MSADDLHAHCICEDPEMNHDQFAAEYCGPVRSVVDQLQNIDLSANGGLDEICDLAGHLLVNFIQTQPTPALRYAALEGVVYHLVEALAPAPTMEAQA